MLKSFVAVLLIILSLTLSSCTTTTGITGLEGLKSYISTQGYEFLYPNGWVPVDVKNASEGVDVVFRDLIEKGENLSVIISDVPQNKTLTELGTATEVGYRFLKQVNTNPNLSQETDLITAESREANGNTYYLLEYQVKQPNGQERHNLASVTINHGKLFTFNISTAQERWQKLKNLFQVIVNSFTVR
jgi:photosystem II oxygen-evolving enhancer protein 2